MCIRDRLDGDEYVINGSKTFITNGYLADLVLLVCKTDPSLGAKGMSIIVLEVNDLPGFRRGRILDKLGQKGQDTSELFFDDVRVPVANLLGPEEGKGFIQLMQQLPEERMFITMNALGSMERAVEEPSDTPMTASCSASHCWTCRTPASNWRKCRPP